MRWIINRFKIPELERISFVQAPAHVITLLAENIWSSAVTTLTTDGDDLSILFTPTYCLIIAPKK